MSQPQLTTPAPPPRAAAPGGNPLPPITYPESLPVSARRDEIARALAAHQVVIVCGETGSGKTTQLPKIALQLGRGKANTGKLIGHTQPRRIAASSVAKRIAEELKTPLGEIVGFKVRFQDRLQPGASVKLMTDGILLAETQTDPLLRAYDTIIIDEAHERSLNIDFLLGHLRQILPRRPDLKIVVTSATIDADRFANHFASSAGPAPIIQVSGRLFPVEQRWRPFEESREYDLNDAIGAAVDELWREGSGDVLVFLPGEREIREAADHLRKHHPPGVEVVPLFARLSQQEQDHIFEPHSARRIVLATNVAETSLTVPGIQFVIDAGTARVKRYSYRNKVEQLLVEPISQAAANQRAGRCGRVSDGICIRLYDEKEFAGRPKFSDPEILRSSLAGVILRMKSLGLGTVEDFPFLEPPPRRAIADGYQLLAELGAVDDFNELTPIGRELARLPLDPRVGRMILEARSREALTEVLIIAAAFSVQEVRDRPLEHQQAADAAHKKFDDERSEFIGDLKLWKWLEDAKGGAGEHKVSQRKQEQLLRDNFISPRRVREWRDIHSQLHTVVAEHKWRLNGAPATYEQIHLSMLAGLLGNIGAKSEDEDWYLGARGIRFYKHPGANLSKKPGRWIVAAELVETTRLFGRSIAAIEPLWLERIGAHVIKKQLLEPHWEKKAAEVVALERATLYGIVIYSNRRVNFGNVDAVAAREIFIREALVAGEWETKLPFVAANRKLIAQVEELEHKSRRQDVLVDDELIHGFYDAQLPADVCSGHSLERWYRDEVKRQPRLLMLTREELMRHEAAGITSSAFPKTIRLGGVDCAATYLHSPGDAKDGVTVAVPIYSLNQVNDERCEWLVPGMLKDKVLALVKSLHQRPRSRLVPLPDYAQGFIESVEFGNGSLLDVLLKHVRDKTQLDIKRADFKLEQLPPHLLMNFRINDEHGRQLGTGRNLAALKAELGGQARSAFQALAGLKVAAAPSPSPQPSPAGGRGSPALLPAPPAGEGRGEGAQKYTTWTFGELPELMEIRKAGQSLIGFPALIDRTTHVEIEVFDEPDVAARKHRAGLRRLIALQIRDALKYLERNIPDLQKMSVAYLLVSQGSADELRDQIIDVALDRAFLADTLPTDAAAFARTIEGGRGRLTLIANEVARSAGTILLEHTAALRKLKDARAPKEVADDITAQLGRLVPKRFVADTPWAQLAHLPRYLKAIVMRLDKQRADPARDAQRLAELRPIESRYWRHLADRKGVVDARLDEFRWLLEELRVSLFAQELRTPQPVSVKRLEKVWAQLAS
jgi:ATP-dependent helicase HrpA